MFDRRKEHPLNNLIIDIAIHHIESEKESKEISLLRNLRNL